MPRNNNRRVRRSTRRLPGRRRRVNPTKKYQPVNRRDVHGETVRELIKQTQPHMMPRNMFCPEAVVVDLTYPDVVFNRNNSGAPILSWRYRMNSVFDPDPGVSSGAVPGHLEWSSMYQVYRVMEMSYTIDICNLEPSPVDTICVPTLDDVGLNYASLIELFGNPYANQGMVSAKTGMDRIRLQGSIDLGKFYGLVSQYLGNDNFGSAVTGNPSVFFYLNVGGVNAVNFTASNGLDVRVTLKYRVHYHKRRVVTG